MADLADQIDDFICSFEGASAGDLTMDTLAMLVFCWAVVGLFVAWLCKFLYHRYVRRVPTGSAVEITKLNEIKTKSESDLVSPSVDKVLENGLTVNDLGGKEKAVAGRVALGGGRGRAPGYVPPTPPTRKRLSRKSPGPELTTRRRSLPHAAPHCSGAEPQAVRWVEELLQWLYSDHVVVHELLAAWVKALNNHQAASVEEHGVGVEIIRLLPETPVPVLSNVFAESIGQETSVTMDIETTPVFQLKAFRQKAGKVDTAHYRVTVNRYRGRLCARLQHHALKGEVRPEGWPDVRLSLASIGAIRGATEDETQLQDLVTEIVTAALRGAACPLDLAVYPTCPRYRDLGLATPPRSLSLHYDSMSSMDRSTPLGSGATHAGRRLLVKVVRGEGLRGPTGAVHEPYCVVEMDEPPQRNQTGNRPGASPFWDEHFLFDLSPHTAELLFEVYDKPVSNTNSPSKDSPTVGSASRFLGLGLVGVDELAVGPCSSQVLTLQPRPYETDKAFGSITVEFVFIEGAEVPAGRRPYKLKEALHMSPGRSPTHQDYPNSHNGGVDLAHSAIRAIESGATAGPGASKSTLIIHSVHRQPPRQSLKVEMTEQGSFIEVEPEEIVPETENGTEVAESEAGEHTPMSMPTQNGAGTLPTSEDNRGRNRKKRDFFGTIKRRLGRSKLRTKSMDRATAEAAGIGLESRSISADRGVLGGSGGAGGAGQRLLVPRNNSGDNQGSGSRHSSFSEGSAISGASARTYVHEASTLVLETLENGVRRHFLVPVAVAQRPRWRRKGTKLHIYNDHTFVAKHLSGGQLCGICSRSIARRPGKQGYECRDCALRCHKQCHVRAPQLCPNPTVLSIELSKLNSPQTDRHIRKL